MLTSASRIARPMAALLRVPGPNALWPELMPSSATTGPLTMTSGAHKCVVACTPYRLNGSSHIASIASMNKGK